MRGVPVFGNGLKVKVTRDGRVLSVQGSPVSGLSAASPPGRRPLARRRRRALRVAAQDVSGKVSAVATATTGATGDTVWANHDYAKKVWFLTPSGLRPGGAPTTTTGSAAAYQHVIDASERERPLPALDDREDNGDAYVYDNYPGAAKGGKAKVVNFIKKGWLKQERARSCSGANVVAWTDVNDDNLVENEREDHRPRQRRGARPSR